MVQWAGDRFSCCDCETPCGALRDGAVRGKAVCLMLGINLAGETAIIGLLIAQSEGAKFWLQVVTELRNRGVQDFIRAVFQKTNVQLYITHVVRHSLSYVFWRRRTEVAVDLKRIYHTGEVIDFGAVSAISR